MKKQLCAVLVIHVMSTAAYQEKPLFKHYTAQATVGHIFGPHGTNAPEEYIQSTIDLINKIYSVAPYDLYNALYLAAEQLKIEQKKVTAAIKQLKQNNEPVPAQTFYNRFLLNHQIKHLYNHAQKIGSTLSFIQRIKGLTGHGYRTARARLGRPHVLATTTTSEQLAHAIINFCNFEREQIAPSYSKLVRYFSEQINYPLPEAISFWKSKKLQQNLYRHAHRINPKVEVQAITAIIELLVQTVLMMGSSLYSSWIDKEKQEEYNKLLDKQKKIQEDFSRFKDKLSTNSNALVTGIASSFATAQKDIIQGYSDLTTNLQNERIYLLQAINLAPPRSAFLMGGTIALDQLFEASKLSTPPSRAWYQTWYIPSRYPDGDWQYDGTNNSFWQNIRVLFGTPFWEKQNNKDQKTQFNYPDQNSIFTEYQTDQKSYAIEVDINLINVTYPFFVGIMFNKGRWIPGVYERFWQYRLAGLYGSQDSNNIQTINFNFAQEKIVLDEAQKVDIDKTASPLQLIVNNNGSPLYTLDQALVKDLVKNPQSFTVLITTQADNVTLTLKQRDGDTKKELYTGTVSNLSTSIFLYGGIGFMAVGCQAEFKLIQPTELVYTQQEITNFNTNK